MPITTIFHCSDLHFGHPAVPVQYEAIEDLIAERKYDVVAISGDLTQKCRSGEFQGARGFIHHAALRSKTIVVPGNHDVAWWLAPFGVGDARRMMANYRRYISDDLEPVLRVAGATFVGLNSAPGITTRTLTWNPLQLSVIGRLTSAQIERAGDEFGRSRQGDARIIVMHHNPVKGELSQRHGLKSAQRVLGAFAEMGVDLVLCGHDHQEAVHYIEHTKRGTVISTAGTMSNRGRGGLPSSVNSISISDAEIEVSTLVWSDREQTWLSGPQKRFPRQAL